MKKERSFPSTSMDVFTAFADINCFSLRNTSPILTQDMMLIDWSLSHGPCNFSFPHLDGNFVMTGMGDHCYRTTVNTIPTPSSTSTASMNDAPGFFSYSRVQLDIFFLDIVVSILWTGPSFIFLYSSTKREPYSSHPIPPIFQRSHQLMHRVWL